MTRPIAILGAGSMGVAWAIVFARSGRSVHVYDPVAERLPAARAELLTIAEELSARALIRETPKALAARIRFTNILAEAVSNAAYVQECAPERTELKTGLFAEAAGHAPTDAIFASSSSAIPISTVAEALPFRERCLVVHPLNPPFLLRVVELVPAAFTDPAVINAARTLMDDVGMQPLIVEREIEGFLFNRLQGALLREAYCLVRDGVASVADVDRAISEGLGVRWSVIGPFETVDLNTRGGIRSHAEKLGPAYARMGAERGQDDPWTPDLVARVEAERRSMLPLEQWQERVRWRDRRLMDIARLRVGPDWWEGET
jgi:L-gulonate 3-dehydrogenase